MAVPFKTALIQRLFELHLLLLLLDSISRGISRTEIYSIYGHDHISRVAGGLLVKALDYGSKDPGFQSN